MTGDGMTDKEHLQDIVLLHMLPRGAPYFVPKDGPAFSMP